MMTILFIIYIVLFLNRLISLDEMADRVGDLEKSIGVLVDQAGIDKAKFAEEVSKERAKVNKPEDEK